MSTNLDRPEELAKFHGRTEAGNLLSALLSQYLEQKGAIVMAIPRGGVPVGMEIARALRLPLGLVVVEKIRIPEHDAWQSIRSLGAVAAGVAPILDSQRIKMLRIPPADLERASCIARNDQIHKTELYRRVCPPVKLRDQTVLVIDDAVDTGMTMEAAIRSLRLNTPAKIVVAAPVGSAAAIRQLTSLADRVVIPIQAAEGAAVHECYAHFPPIDDAEVYALMERCCNEPPRARARAQS